MTGPDRWAVRAIVVIIGIVVVFATVTICLVALFEINAAPAAVLAVGGVITTGLGILAPSPLSKGRDDAPSGTVEDPVSVAAPAPLPVDQVEPEPAEPVRGRRRGPQD